jgi:hypothetical protein
MVLVSRIDRTSAARWLRLEARLYVLTMLDTSSIHHQQHFPTSPLLNVMLGFAPVMRLDLRTAAWTGLWI